MVHPVKQGRVALLSLHKLGLSLDEIERITGEDGDLLARYLLGVQPIPKWLVTLAFLWSEYPGSLERAREIASAPSDEPTNGFLQ